MEVEQQRQYLHMVQTALDYTRHLKTCIDPLEGEHAATVAREQYKAVHARLSVLKDSLEQSKRFLRACRFELNEVCRRLADVIRLWELYWYWTGPENSDDGHRRVPLCYLWLNPWTNWNAVDPRLRALHVREYALYQEECELWACMFRTGHTDPERFAQENTATLNLDYKLTLRLSENQRDLVLPAGWLSGTPHDNRRFDEVYDNFCPCLQRIADLRLPQVNPHFLRTVHEREPWSVPTESLLESKHECDTHFSTALEHLENPPDNPRKVAAGWYRHEDFHINPFVYHNVDLVIPFKARPTTSVGKKALEDQRSLLRRRKAAAYRAIRRQAAREQRRRRRRSGDGIGCCCVVCPTAASLRCWERCTATGYGCEWRVLDQRRTWWLGAAGCKLAAQAWCGAPGAGIA